MPQRWISPPQRHYNYILPKFLLLLQISSGKADFISSGRAAYVKCNYEMINNSKYCIVYYDEQNAPTSRKSGTKIALDYAIKKGREIILVWLHPRRKCCIIKYRTDIHT